MPEVVVITAKEIENIIYQNTIQNNNILLNKIEEKLSNLKNYERSHQMLSVKEAANFFRSTEQTIHNWKKQGKLKYKKLGRKVLFTMEDLMEAANDRRK